MKSFLLALPALLLMTSCSHDDPAHASAHDIHSYARPEEARVTHVALDLNVIFNQLTIQGTATLTIEHAAHAKQIVLDTRRLQIDETELSADGQRFRETNFEEGKADAILGTPLTVAIDPDTKYVRVRYSTSPSGATALQWLTPEQTAGKQHPFLYTQSEAIHARSWIPLQDSPGIRVTWEAKVKVPAPLKAVMSGVDFRMDHPVPPYLIALAVGDLRFKSTGSRTGVWAEPSVLEKAANEFADMEKMMDAAEALYGPYRWGRYDVLVLPPSFPFGGMENPCLTFATPTVIAGDKSLVSLVAHEMAHSWSGNLVTNATWSDFWLNEGFTVYIERRILEQVYGKPRAEMEAVLGYQDLQDELKKEAPRDQILNIDLKGRDPDDGMTQIPYEKGALFLTQLEQTFGREKFDAWLKSYFANFSFRSITTAEALDFMKQSLLQPDAGVAKKIDLDTWIHKPGLPASAPVPHAEAFDEVDAAAKSWRAGQPIDTARWSTQEWLRFLHALPDSLPADEMARLDSQFQLTQSTNNEILDEWLLKAIRSNYLPARDRLDDFLLTVGRRKYVKPLYEAMSPAHARAVYERARPAYHPITQATIDALLAGR